MQKPLKLPIWLYLSMATVCTTLGGVSAEAKYDGMISRKALIHGLATQIRLHLPEPGTPTAEQVFFSLNEMMGRARLDPTKIDDKFRSLVTADFKQAKGGRTWTETLHLFAETLFDHDPLVDECFRRLVDERIVNALDVVNALRLKVGDLLSVKRSLLGDRPYETLADSDFDRTTRGHLITEWIRIAPFFQDSPAERPIFADGRVQFVPLFVLLTRSFSGLTNSDTLDAIQLWSDLHEEALRQNLLFSDGLSEPSTLGKMQAEYFTTHFGFVDRRNQMPPSTKKFSLYTWLLYLVARQPSLFDFLFTPNLNRLIQDSFSATSQNLILSPWVIDHMSSSIKQSITDPQIRRADTFFNLMFLLLSADDARDEQPLLRHLDADTRHRLSTDLAEYALTPRLRSVDRLEAIASLLDLQSPLGIEQASIALTRTLYRTDLQPIPSTLGLLQRLQTKFKKANQDVSAGEISAYLKIFKPPSATFFAQMCNGFLSFWRQ